MRVLPLLSLLLLTPFVDAHTQEHVSTTDANNRVGGWFGVGLTFGKLSGAATQYSGGNYTATVNVRTGGSISRHIRVGGELDVGAMEGGGSADFGGAVVSLTLGAYAYPSASADFFFKGGVGVRHFAEVLVEYADAATDLIGVVGMGYDWRPSGGRFSLTPFLQYTLSLSTLSTEGPRGPDEWNIRVWQFGVSFTWH